MSYIRTAEHRKMMSEINKGCKPSPSSFKKGHKHSDIVKKKLSQARKGKYKGSENPNWKNGKTYDGQGYVLFYRPNHLACDKRGYVRRSHLVMEKTIGRYLKHEEIIHHKNEIRDDDRPANLQLFANNSEHIKFHHLLTSSRER